MTERDPLVLLQESLTDAELHQFLANARGRWPRLDGAHVADVLELTTDHDMFLDQTEPFYEAHEAEMPAGVPNYAALHLLIILGRELTVENLTAVLARAGLWPARQGPRVQYGTLKDRPEGEPAIREMTAPGELIQHGTVTGRLPRRTPVPSHPEHTIDGPENCPRCQLLRDNAHWMEPGRTQADIDRDREDRQS